MPEEEAGENENKVEVEKDSIIEKELQKYDAARGGGFSSSDEDDDGDDDEGGVEIEEEVEFPDMQAEAADVEMGEVTSRIAVVNLDWDNIRSVDLMAVFGSFVRPGGRIHKISIYQSEFGKERMEREELEGPPKEIFSQRENKNQQEEEEDSEDGDEDEDDEDEDEDDEDDDEKIKKHLLQEDEGKEFDGAALRQYQLERLRYYYAVIVCSDEVTAEKIYEATDGTEYLSSANFFDLRFIPDETEFEDNPRDECDAVPTGYKPVDFVTDALQHSRVKLTWDMDPGEASRKDAIKRAFSGSRAEIGENDLRAYLGSDSEDEDEEEAVGEPELDAPKLNKKDQARQKMRAALGLSAEPATRSKKPSGPVGDMEITFTAGLTSKDKGSVFENEPIKIETTAEMYIRKEKERKARRKAKAKTMREGLDPEAGKEGSLEPEKNVDLGFNDPFFATDEAVKTAATNSLRKAEREKKREAKAEEAGEKASNRAELELLMQDNSTETAPHLDHFDIKEISRVEKAKKKKKKGKKGQTEVEGGKRGGLQESFEMDVQDPRFAKVFENHEFAIDPSNPKFKGTEGMKKLLEEGRRKRGVEVNEEMGERKGKKRKVSEQGQEELSRLVQMVKKKAQK